MLIVYNPYILLFLTFLFSVISNASYPLPYYHSIFVPNFPLFWILYIYVYIYLTQNTFNLVGMRTSTRIFEINTIIDFQMF